MGEPVRLLANIVAWPCAVAYLVGFFWIFYEATAHAHVLQPAPEKTKATLGEKIAGVGIAAVCVTFAVSIWRAIQRTEAERKAFWADPIGFELDLATYITTGALILSAGVCGVGFIMVARDLRRARKERQRLEAYTEWTG